MRVNVSSGVIYTGTRADTDTDTDTATGIGTGTGTDTDTRLKASQEALEGSQKELKRRGGGVSSDASKTGPGGYALWSPQDGKAHLGAKKNSPRGFAGQ